MERTLKKSTKLPKPMKVKREKSDDLKSLQSMAYYVDDRLELVKQVFGTLKPKTIINLAPEFLKKKKLEKIEEFCLTELLCISKKRLLSIINGATCPTDTESSSDSDVEEQEEHVSLEEVSSDSNIGQESTRRAKKKNAHKSGEKSIDQAAGVISVLELLELQARARAIRSQLALEPVTKIEVEDDAEKCATKTNGKSELIQNHKDRKGRNMKANAIVTASGDASRGSTSSQEFIGSGSTEKSVADCDKNENKSSDENKSNKKVKIKRNYPKPKELMNGDFESKTTVEVKEERKSLSPDVIPIVAEPETLCISDSSDEESEKKKRKTIENEQKQVTESNKIDENKPLPKRKMSEVEDGEISESEQELTEGSDDKATEEKTSEETKQIEATSENHAIIITSIDIEINGKDKSPSSDDAELNEKSLDGTYSIQDNSNQSSNIDENDDVISIEGSDIESEMIKDLERDPKKHKSDVRLSHLHLSSEEENKDQADQEESWRERYLNSSKVNKVLTASRLGKRVRDRMKNSKTASTKSEEPEAAEVKVAFQSKHEDGSVEQYKELLELKTK